MEKEAPVLKFRSQKNETGPVTTTACIDTAAILKHKNGLLFEIQKPEKWRHHNGLPLISLGCIGDRVEPGETPSKCLQRDVCNETGCEIQFLSPSTKLILRPQ